jgi:polyhydroxybutyrate depolymerase
VIPSTRAHHRRGPSGWAVAACVIALLAVSADAQRQTSIGGAAGNLTAGDHTFPLRHDGRTRRYIVRMPPRTSGQLPVMLAFHGGGGNAEGFKDYAGLDALADRERFIVLYPNGTGVLPNRLLTFNGGGCCGYAADRNVDDVGFAMAAVDDLARRTPVDRARIYATGHSNGAIMAYRLAAERSEAIAAIVPVAGAMNVSSFSPARPVAVMHIHSVDDPRALYGGGLGPPFPGTSNRETHVAVQVALDRWIRANGCATAPRVGETRSGRAGSPDASHTATRLAWSPCRDGAEVVHWKLTGAGHGWPGQARGGLREGLVGPQTTIIDAAAEAWAFASRFRLR